MWGTLEMSTAIRTGKKTLHTGRAKFADGGFAVYAQQYLDAFCQIHDEGRFNPVRYYLCCHALELAFKAYLLKNGQQISTLRSKKVGHNLEELLRLAAGSGLGLRMNVDTTCETEVKKANRYYFKKGFEYFDVEDAMKGRDELPNLPTLERFARELVRLVALK